jgi:hypothetical protein
VQRTMKGRKVLRVQRAVRGRKVMSVQRAVRVRKVTRVQRAVRAEGGVNAEHCGKVEDSERILRGRRVGRVGRG